MTNKTALLDEHILEIWRQVGASLQISPIVFMSDPLMFRSSIREQFAIIAFGDPYYATQKEVSKIAKLHPSAVSRVYTRFIMEKRQDAVNISRASFTTTRVPKLPIESPDNAEL